MNLRQEFYLLHSSPKTHLPSVSDGTVKGRGPRGASRQGENAPQRRIKICIHRRTLMPTGEIFLGGKQAQAPTENSIKASNRCISFVQVRIPPCFVRAVQTLL